ncbi:MAG: DUF169 domain-containing protein [Treponema sp.]|nr:DUF169 domain-containing protein [Treponema sp.]
MNAKEIGESLTRAARLPGKAVSVFASDDVRRSSVEVSKIDRCLARSVFKISMEAEAPSAYFGVDARAGICPGGQGWCGMADASPMIKYFISTGRPDYRNGAAEYLKPSPEAAERLFSAPGRIALPSKYLNLARCDRIEDDQEVLSFILIGGAESIRNLGGLIQFVSDDIFGSILMPGGPDCASMITYAAGLAERAPRRAAFVGPVDPTGNAWMPPDMMTLALPFETARAMAENVGSSFLAKRPDVAFPGRGPVPG